MNVKMYHENDKNKVVEVTNQIQRDAFLKEGFVDAPNSEQPQPKDGEPAVLAQDSAQADEMASAAPAKKSASTSTSRKSKGAK